MSDRIAAEALVLLARFIEAVEARRQIEADCAYPETYGGDKEVLEDARSFFKREQVHHYIARLSKQ